MLMDSLLDECTKAQHVWSFDDHSAIRFHFSRVLLVLPTTPSAIEEIEIEVLQRLPRSILRPTYFIHLEDRFSR
jgi:hypothetical protein